MFAVVECAVAVHNALKHVKDIADWTTSSPGGEGVCQLIELLIRDDLASLDHLLLRHFLPVGEKSNGEAYEISPAGTNLLISGSSGSGKTTLCAALLEQITAKGYQYCLIDPEGDYNYISGALNIGDSVQIPSIDQALQLLTRPEENVVLCITAVSIEDRPDFFRRLVKELILLRKNTGHPHFIILDEAHHMIPKNDSDMLNNTLDNFDNFIAITTNPTLMSNEILARINMAMIIGHSPVQKLCYLTKKSPEQLALPPDLSLNNRQVMLWRKKDAETTFVKSYAPRRLLMRHKRKYASGDMGSNSFYFKGPAGLLNLKANNLMLFIQLAKGLDDETWQYHLHRHDYSKWFRQTLKDEGLARLSETVEGDVMSALDSRSSIFEMISDRYTTPA